MLLVLLQEAFICGNQSCRSCTHKDNRITLIVLSLCTQFFYAYEKEKPKLLITYIVYKYARSSFVETEGEHNTRAATKLDD